MEMLPPGPGSLKPEPDQPPVAGNAGITPAAPGQEIEAGPPQAALDPELICPGVPWLGAGPPGLGAGDAVALAAVFVAVFAAIGIPFGVTRWFTGWEPGGYSAVLVAETIAGLATIALGLRWSGLRLSSACPVRHYPLRIVPALLLGSFGATILFGEIVRWIPGSQAFQRALLLEFGQSSTLAIFLSGSVGAPVLEELVCRGVLLSGLRRRYRVGAALWLSAILFAIIHLNPWQAVGALPLGLAWGWLVLRTGSIVPGILSHAMVNFSSSFLIAPLLLGLGYSGAELRNASHFPPLLLAIGGAAAVVGTLGVWWQLRGREPAPEPSPPPPPVLAVPGRAGARLATTMTAAVLLVGATPAARFYLARRPAPADTRAAGCYALLLPADARARLFPGIAGTHVRVRLSRVPYRRAWEDRRKFLVQPLDGGGAATGATASSAVYWFAASPGNLRIVGHHGSALTLVRLRLRGDELAGDARQSSGVAGEAVDEAGAVSGRRIDCPAASGRPQD